MASYVQPVEFPHTTIERGFARPVNAEDCVEFRLLYTGELPPDGDAPTKQRIRSYFHPQLKKLWSLNLSLLEWAQTRGQIASSLSGKQTDNEDEMALLGMEYLAANYEEYGFNFLPLVEKDYCLSCSLDILFLRKGGQGHLVTNGDLDARIKTLFDALQKPQQKNECGGAIPTEDEKPFFVLLQNDKLVSELKITTDQLLDYSGPFLPNSSVHLVIGVRLTPAHYGNWKSWAFR